ncbi:type II toxin-antitoxin system VapC family toxin [uncultured Thiodictyon sp.]|uniref:type II toxin-antitoxin system VapC family toxin n=1 Tax=uncultured Thiodictyon sp. TaxID=1846217 RepID=UPI0025D2F8B5|nr:type II toxin-antitoxin system VapC family toxin [uncultured Thiodictyon sp.]
MQIVKPTIYLETSVVSYLTSRPSRDLITAARQQITREWWELAPGYFDISISDLVIEEAARGDPSAAMLRLQALQDLPVLTIETAARVLAISIMEAGAIPATEPEDALHIAIATIAQAHYLVTWNFAHLVGPDTKLRLLDTLRALGHTPPLLTTPEELLEIAK